MDKSVADRTTRKTNINMIHSISIFRNSKRRNFIRHYSSSRSKAVYGIPSHYSELFEAMNLQTLEYRDEQRLKSTVTVFFPLPPHPTIMDTLMILMCFIFLLEKHVYPRIDRKGSAKIVPVIEFIRGEKLENEKDDVFGCAIGDAIHIIKDGRVRDLEEIAPLIYRLICIIQDRYQFHYIYSISIHVYSNQRIEGAVIKTDDAVISELAKRQILEKVLLYRNNKITEEEAAELRQRKSKSSKYPDFITKLTNKNKMKQKEYDRKIKNDPNWEGKPPTKTLFMVADIETIKLYPREYVDGSISDTSKIPYKQHFPYAASFMVVKPEEGEKLDKDDICHCFSHEFVSTYPCFYDQSEQVLRTFVKGIIREGKKVRKTPIVYFHNMARFDGIIMAEHLSRHYNEWKVIPNMRNGVMYEVTVYKKPKIIPKKGSGERLLFRLRCSLLILPLSLNKLAKDLCPELKGKEIMDHSAVTLESLNNREDCDKYKSYLAHDVFLLANIMKKTQAFFWDEFHVDIVNYLTIASLSLTIFRMDYYDDVKHRMYIPNANADKFIRRGYHGGHSDVYIPVGKDLYAYDVNSLYPSVMVGNKMPGGKPVWHPNLTDRKLEDLFGFVEAIVWCDDKEERPFLPSKRPGQGTLLFPAGSHFGVFFTEELKYAEKLGYTVTVACGYLFEPMESPFDAFVSDLYARRRKAIITGNDVASKHLKFILNNLYGRLAINPECTQTTILDNAAADAFVERSTFKSYEEVAPNMNIISYTKNVFDPRGPWVPPMISSPQFSAAITAYSRIFMYPHISRKDCYYTDTDSVVLQKPLQEEWVSDTELGKFKLEHGGPIRKAVFMAPKCYYLQLGTKKIDADGNELEEYDGIVKYKGAPQGSVTPEFFLAQADNIKHKETVVNNHYFRIDYTRFVIYKRESSFELKLNSNKRLPVIDKNGKWIRTKPVSLTPEEVDEQLRGSKTSGILLSKLSRENAELRKRIPKKYRSSKDSDSN